MLVVLTFQAVFYVVFKIGNSIYSNTGIGRDGCVFFQTEIQRYKGRAVELITLYSRVL
jgi:hypothetical protein